MFVGSAVPRGDGWRAGRPRFGFARIIRDVQDVNFAVSGDAAEDHSPCGFDPALNLEQLPPHPRPEIDRDVLVEVGLKSIIHGWEYMRVVSSVG